MKRAFAAGFVCCGLIAGLLGAAAIDNEYADAVANVQGEYAARLILTGDTGPDRQKRLEACQRRALYWVSIMEKFKP